MKKQILEKILENFKLSEKEQKLIDKILVEEMNLPRLLTVINTMIDYHIQDEVLVAYVLFQFSKVNEKEAGELKTQLTESQQKLFDIFKILKSVTDLTKSGEAEDIRCMFVAICQDMRVVIIKFATILYDLKLIKNPMSESDRNFVQMVSDIFAPLAERLGLSRFKNEFEDSCFELLEPHAFEELKNNALLKTEDNQKQIAITKEKLEQILSELGIKGEIQSRQKHFYSVYKKLVKKNITLGKIYDLVAMRVLVPTVEDCYSVFGKIHAIYKPMQGRVKDYIATPKPNGYQSLHTTIIADNNRPLEIQIRTFEMHKQSEYGVAAHWIYKEKVGRARNKFDHKLAWFRQMLDSTNDMSSEEFLETLKVDLYGESIFVQTPKGKVMEFPLGATIIDFAYAIHSDIGNSCVGGKINGKIVPITTELSNGDVVEILTSQNSKGPSRDWLLHVKTSSARSKIRSFFKSELKEENIKIGKSILEQTIKGRNLNITKEQKENFLLEIVETLMIDDLDNLYAELGAGSMSANNIVGRLVNLYNKEKSMQIKNNVITVKKNKDGILVDGDSGLMVRYAGCCTPVTGDDIIGYISRGRGVTIHRAGCQNLKYLEPERLIKAEWQENMYADFIANIKVHADNENDVINALNNSAREFKNKLRGFGYKVIKDELVFDIAVQISNKVELESLINSISNVKKVRKVYRSE
ncbi:MAG: bifunctional (p)ppGpp synthetase/guanosine-3',5'-bis(diphosphate) 3'-pyrophosphohydrolase [Clostridia bacterium]|nr:bifunctional (p)ppGpp synthetase/guanosine-3',5'-bis(diphosphate) 3'-pyrophosphohydrolase [Clostridia bacterium]